MTLDEIKKQLQKTYQILQFIDLADFDPDQRGRLYNCLRRIRRPAFNEHERIVFIASKNLTKTYNDQPHNMITVLQQTVQTHDIPHYFCLVVSDIESIDADLEYVRSKYNPQEKLAICHYQWNN